jgi:hypothetical protein
MSAVWYILTSMLFDPNSNRRSTTISHLSYHIIALPDAFKDFVFECKLYTFTYTLIGMGERKIFFYLINLEIQLEILFDCAKKKYRNLIKDVSSHDGIGY